MDLQPVDYVSGLGQLPDALKAFEQQQAFKVGLEGAKADAAAKQAAVAEVADKLERQHMFQGDLQTTLADPSASNISSLIMKYPEFADQIKGGWEVKDKAAKQADLTQLGEIYSAAGSGNWDLAKKTAQARLDADKAAGQAYPEDEQLVEMLGSGDPAKQKAALGLIGTHIAAVTGPEHFGTVFGALKGGYTLDAGATRFDDNGNIIAQSPFLKTADGGILERDGANGTPASSGTPAAASTAPGGDAGFDAAVAFTLKHEGGYNPHDMNGAPVNFGINQGANPGVDVKKLTQLEAAQIYKDKYWKASGAANLPPVMQVPYFDTYIINPKRAEQFLAKSGGDPNKFMALREAWMGSVAAKNPKYKKAYETRNADLRLTIAGMQGQGGASQPASSGGAPPGYHVLVPGKTPEPKDSFRILTPEEATAHGLDPNLKYQVNDKNGAITLLGGQSRQTKQIPQAVVSKAQPTVDVRDTMARLAGTWKNEFGGHTVLGDNLNTLQRTLGSYSGAPEGMANWWADYQSMDNLVRNQLFGSALTEHEKQAYAATTISPRMDPEEIRKRFNRRRQIINAVAARQQAFLKKNGYDPDAVDALFAPLGGGAEPSSASSTAAPVHIRSVQEAQRLAPGTLYVAPDGKVRRR